MGSFDGDTMDREEDQGKAESASNDHTKCDDEESSPPATTKKWQKRWDFVQETRQYKEQLVKKGVSGHDLWEAMATFALNHKLEAMSQKCPNCWHAPNHCICGELRELSLNILSENIDIEFLILMHHKEYLSGGNSAKLLLQLLPKNTKLYLYGKQGEVDRLRNHITTSSTFVLWPSDTAVKVGEWMEEHQRKQQSICSGDDRPSIFCSHRQPIQAIVLDGTYCQARNMHSSLQKLLGSEMIDTVKLSPTQDSVFHRAQKNYGQAHRKQGSQGNDTTTALAKRVSTAEACGLLLAELGAAPEVEQAIVESVRMNNEALNYARKAS